MKILAFNGSPKGEQSNTAVMINSLLAGLASRNTEINQIYLSHKKINYCTGCYSCWTKTPGVCIIQDDMKEVIKQMKGVDIFIFGSPLYFNNISGILKTFFDRLTAAGGNPHQSQTDTKASPYFIMMSNCGHPYKKQFDVVSLWIHNVSNMMQAKLIGEFYTTDGKVLTQATEEQQNSRANYLHFLEECGKQYLLDMELKDEQKALLDRNILDF